jgi:hypothetical protein
MLARMTTDLEWLHDAEPVKDLSAVLAQTTVPELRLREILTLKPTKIDPTFLTAAAPLAVGYALLVAMMPFRRRAMIWRAAFGAVAIGFLADRLPTPAPVLEIPSLRSRMTSIAAWMQGPMLDTPGLRPMTSGIATRMHDGRFLSLLVAAAVVLILIPASVSWISRPIRLRVDKGWTFERKLESRSVAPCTFRPLGPARRFLAASLICVMLLATLWIAAAVRVTLIHQPQPYGLSGAYLQRAYLFLAALVSLVICESAYRGHPTIYRAAVAAAIARGLWPWPIPGMEFFESSPVSAPWLSSLEAFWGLNTFWVAVGVYLPIAWILAGVAGRLLRWNPLPHFLPITRDSRAFRW